MLEDRTSRRVAIGVTLVTILAAVAAAVVLIASGGAGEEDRAEEPPPPPISAVTASDFTQQVIDRTTGPGYAAWVGAWTMPGGDLMISYVQGSGEVDPSKRERVPPEVLGKFALTPADIDPTRDFWGVDLRVRYKRSSDGGKTWEDVRTDPYQALIPQARSEQPTTALPDGTILRRLNGDDLRQDDQVEHTALLERLPPESEEWTPPEPFCDPAELTCQVSRIRRLRDGRLLATGNAWDVPASVRPGERRQTPNRFLLLVSNDDGASWEEALDIPEADARSVFGNEWDTAELDDGDLVAVMRTYTDPSRRTPIVKQAILRKDGQRWTMTGIAEAPFGVTGHPELLRTKEGAILHIATDGVRWTQDGIHWKPVAFTPQRDYVSHYYPRAVQTEDGAIHVFSHLGGDDPFQAGTHGIVEDTFRIDVQRGAQPAAR